MPSSLTPEERANTRTRARGLLTPGIRQAIFDIIKNEPIIETAARTMGAARYTEARNIAARAIGAEVAEIVQSGFDAVDDSVRAELQRLAALADRGEGSA